MMSRSGKVGRFCNVKFHGRSDNGKRIGLFSVTVAEFLRRPASKEEARLGPHLGGLSPHHLATLPRARVK